MRVIADLQLHSRFSRAVSQQMSIPVISEWAAKKGIGLVATGDWTHPIWLRELKSLLVEAGEGIYQAKETPENSPKFLLSTEISSIYSQGGKGRRIHTLIFAPSFEIVEKINRELVVRGANLLSDGRPIVGLTAKNVAEIALSVDARCLVIPAHAWTPHFSLYGSISGFDSITECFEEIAPQIYAIETGLSSDPAMNWRIAELANRRIVSFSDAHSPQKLGREATVFDLKDVSFSAIYRAIKGEGPDKIDHTLEFYPEEGKYHYTGHRNCKVVYSPNEARKMGTICPVCGRELTVGVMSRVENLASYEVETKSVSDEFGVRWIQDTQGKKPPYVMLVPLLEVLAEALSSSTGSQKVLTVYEQLVNSLGSEFAVLLTTPVTDIARVGGERVAEAITKVRRGDITIEPGYDGVFGKVKIWKEPASAEEAIDQGSLF
jgi:uncharacterized protein (TIGR00375 family)